MLWEDAPSFAAAAKTLGVNIPPAPVFVLLAHFFTFLPFGSLNFRLQVFSASVASATLFLLYLVISRIISDIRPKSDKHRPLLPAMAATFGVVALAFSYEFWSQAQNTERFVLAAFFEVLVLYLVTLTGTSKKIIPLTVLVVFLLGLATGIDPVVVSFFPSVAFLIWQRRSIFNFGQLCLLGLAGLAGIVLVFSYLPLASLHHPFIDFARPTTLGRIWHVMTGQGQNFYNPEAQSGNGFTGSPIVFLHSAWHFLQMLILSFTPLLLPFILVGGWFLWKTGRTWFWLLSLIIATNFLLVGLYNSGNQEAWFLLPFVSFSAFAAVGFFWVASKLPRPGHRAALALASLLPLIVWWATLDRRGWRLTDDYINNLYQSVRGPAIVLGEGDLFADSTIYAHEVTTGKHDVTPVVLNLLDVGEAYRENLALTTAVTIPDASALTRNVSSQTFSDYLNDLISWNLKTKSVYISHSALEAHFILTMQAYDTSKPTFTLDTNRFKLVPAGLMMQIVPKDSLVQPNPSDYNYHFTNDFPRTRPHVLENVSKSQLHEMINQYAASYVDEGDYLAQSGDHTGEQTAYHRAVQFYGYALAQQRRDADTANKLGSAYSKLGQEDRALHYFTLAHAFAPKNPQYIFNMATSQVRLGNPDEARPLLKNAISLAGQRERVLAESKAALKLIGEDPPPAAGAWQSFSDSNLHLSFSYPAQFATRSLASDEVGLFANKGSDANPTMLFYSETDNTGGDLQTYASSFAALPPGTLSASQPTTVAGFQEGLRQLYHTDQQDTELLFLKNDSQIIVVVVPLGVETNQNDFAQMLSKIVKSIKVSE
jgi:tetratricopeptide (TPR) repeat protein